MLWLLGGAVRPKLKASSPAAELRIAGLCPLVSLLLDGLRAGRLAARSCVRGGGLLAETAAWLADISVLLAVCDQDRRSERMIDDPAALVTRSGSRAGGIA